MGPRNVTNRFIFLLLSLSLQDTILACQGPPRQSLPRAIVLSLFWMRCKGACCLDLPHCGALAPPTRTQRLPVTVTGSVRELALPCCHGVSLLTAFGNPWEGERRLGFLLTLSLDCSPDGTRLGGRELRNHAS